MIDTGIDAVASRVRRPDRGGRSFVASSWRVGHLRPRHVRRGRDRRQPVQRRRDRRARVQRAAAGREGRPVGLQRLDDAPRSHAIRWAANEGARVINLSLGGNRDPEDPDDRRVLAAGGGRDRVRRLERRPRRRCRRERPAGADDAVAVRRLPGRAAARARGRRAPPGRRRPAITRTATRPYVDIAAPGRADLLDDPAQPDRPLAPGLRRDGVLGLRPVRVPRRPRHLVRGAAGLRRRGAPARRRPDAEAGPGRVAARALGDRRGRRERAAPRARSAATRSPAGAT